MEEYIFNGFSENPTMESGEMIDYIIDTYDSYGEPIFDIVRDELECQLDIDERESLVEEIDFGKSWDTLLMTYTHNEWMDEVVSALNDSMLEDIICAIREYCGDYEENDENYDE